MQLTTRNDLRPFVSPKTGIVTDTYLYAAERDDPRLFNVFVEYPDYTAYLDGAEPVTLRPGGSGWMRQEAVNAAIGETLERYSMVFDHPVQEQSLAAAVEASALRVDDVRWFHDRQYTDLPYAPPEPSDEFRFLEGRTVGGQQVFFPTQFIVSGYHRPDEKRIGYAYSAGCATGYTHKETVVDGLLEQVERDAVLYTWFNRDMIPAIDLASTAALRTLQDKVCRKQVEYLLLDVTTDLGVPAVLGIAWSDELPPCFSFAAAPTMEEACLDALEELGQVRVSAKRIAVSEPSLGTPFDAESFVNNQVNGERQIPPEENEEATDPVTAVRERGYSIYAFDITPPELSEEGLVTTKTIIPELVQFGRADEMFLGQDRLYDQTTYDSVVRNPPPFLH